MTCCCAGLEPSLEPEWETLVILSLGVSNQGSEGMNWNVTHARMGGLVGGGRKKGAGMLGWVGENGGFGM